MSFEWNGWKGLIRVSAEAATVDTRLFYLDIRQWKAKGGTHQLMQLLLLNETEWVVTGYVCHLHFNLTS